jgi:hypothetical protein
MPSILITPAPATDLALAALLAALARDGAAVAAFLSVLAGPDDKEMEEEEHEDDDDDDEEEDDEGDEDEADEDGEDEDDD